MRLIPVLVVAALALAVTAAAPAAPAAPKKALVTWRVAGETFRTYLRQSSDIGRVRQAIREGRSAGIPIGRVVRGERENRGHRWHLANVRLADVTIELCDGRPSYVDRKLGYWADVVGQFCPWSAVPVRLRWVSG